MVASSASMTAGQGTIDPVTLEILWTRLISIVEEAEATLVRTSYSPIVGESDDHSAALLDAQGNILAQTLSAMPAFIGILGRTTRAMLQYFPPETLQPGDVLTTNDPWICCGHLNDLNLLRPIFHRGKLIAFTGNTAHLTDIGGRNSAEGVDLFEEGLRILPSKLYDAGKQNEEIYKFLRGNSRIPEQMIGDLNAQLAATETAERRLLEMVEEYGLDDIEELTAEIQSRTEQVMRAAIAKLPDGDYFGEVYSDGYDATLTIKVRVSIRGDELTIDYDGTSDQVERGINCPMNLTYAESVWPIRVALAPDIPTTEGALRPITVEAPEGSVLNPRFPAAVQARTVVVHNVHAAIFQALASLEPDYIEPANIQAHSGCIWANRFRGQWTERWKPAWESRDHFVSSYLCNGGQGASGVKDGQHCMSYPDNCSNMPIEVVENRQPAIFLRKEIRQDSGGPGKFRGGCGQTIELRVLSDRPISYVVNSGDKILNPAPGLKGGLPGGVARIGRNEQPISARAWNTVYEGDVILHEPPGGGGYGDPFERDPETVLVDVRNGYVSRDAAAQAYGVAISDDLTIDRAETARRRGHVKD